MYIKKMTKNEYFEYMKDCLSKFYTDPSYTKDKCEKDLDSVEVLPFDLSAFPQISNEIKKWISILFKQDDLDGDGNYMVRGFARNESVEINQLNLHYGDYGLALSYWAYNDENMYLYTFCEGDTTLTIFSNEEMYKKAKQKTQDWYKEASA